MSTSKIHQYINEKKTMPPFAMFENSICLETLQNHRTMDKTVEIIEIYSTDIFPEILTIKGKDFVIFDLHYCKYLQYFYTNLMFTIEEINVNPNPTIKPITDNIKSDLYHFIGMQIFNRPVASHYAFLKAKKYYTDLKKFATLNFENQIFFEASTFYMIRHEVAHSLFKKENLNSKRQLIEYLEIIRKMSENGEFEKTQLTYENHKTFNTIETNEALEKIINDPNGKIFEEIFCDYTASIETILYIWSQYADVKSKEDIFDLGKTVVEQLTIFDYINDIFRDTSYAFHFFFNNNYNVNFLEISERLRFSITFPLRYIILYKLTNKLVSEHEFINFYLNANFELINTFQDIIFTYAYQSANQVKTDVELIKDIAESNISNEQAIIKRNQILGWEN